MKLAAAKEVFQGVSFKEIKISGSVVGYSAKRRGGNEYEDKSLTALCKKLWLAERK